MTTEQVGQTPQFIAEMGGEPRAIKSCTCSFTTLEIPSSGPVGTCPYYWRPVKLRESSVVNGSGCWPPRVRPAQAEMRAPASFSPRSGAAAAGARRHRVRYTEHPCP